MLTPVPKSMRSGRLFLVAAGIFLFILYLAYPNPVPDSRADQEQDSFTYISLAQSLLEGKGYPTKHWMPGFPVLLAGMLAVSGLSWLPLKLVMVGISGVTLLFCWRLFLRLVEREGANVLTLVLAATPIFFDYSHRLMSEIPYLAASSLALVSLVEVGSDRLSSRATIVWGALLILSTVAAVLIRGNGLALAPALLLGMFGGSGEPLRERRSVLGAALVGLLAAYGVWSIRCSRLEFTGIDNVTYLQEVQARDIGALWSAGGYQPGVEKIGIREAVRRCYQNAVWYQTYQIADLFVPSSLHLTDVKMPALGSALAIILSLPALAGLVLLWRRSPPCATYLFGSLLICLVYPTGGAARMLLPSLPLLLVAGYLGLEWMLDKDRAWGWLTAILVVNVVLCVIAADQQARHPYSRKNFADFIEILTTDIPTIAQSDEVVVPSLSSASPYWEAAGALTQRKVMSEQDAMTCLSAGQIDSVLLIEEISTATEAPKKPPGGMSDQVLSRRHTVWLVRRLRQ